MKKRIALLLAIVMTMSFLASCGEKKTNVSLEGANVDVKFADYKDSEDVPSWTGEKINVRVWYEVSGPNASIRLPKSPDDVVTPEFQRITGVSFDYDTSIDNGGDSYDAKLAKLVAAKDIPAMAYGLPELADLVDADMLYDLTDYVKEYCPNIMKYFGPETDTYGPVWKLQQEKLGGMFALPTGGHNDSLVRPMAEEGLYEITEEEVKAIAGPGSTPYEYIHVREDVLKAIYPESHTTKELEEIYKKNGKFTEAEIFDVPLEKPQDLVDFMYKVDGMKSQFEDGKGPIYTTFTHSGGDNWMICTTTLPKFGYAGDCFGYYDIEDRQLKITFQQDWYKDIMYTFYKMVKDGVANREALLDTMQTHQEKFNNGRYLVSLAGAPHGNSLKPDGERYRKVYLKYTRNLDKILTNGSSSDSGMKISFFKDSISEAELIQVLRSVDFAASMPGQKLTYWGPKSAGLYTEDENGNLQYVDEDLKAQMLDWNTNGKDLVEKYGLKMGPWPGRPWIAASAYNPKKYYASSIEWDVAYNAAYVDSITYPQYAATAWYGAYTSEVDGAQSFWTARQEWEDAMQRVFASADDAQFEARFKEMLDVAEKNGLNEETIKQLNEVFNREAAPYEGNIEKYLETLKERAK